MASSDVELKAVHAVRGLVLETTRMQPFLSENDKTPSLDGKILVYSKESKEKEYLKGGIPVQIKGESVGEQGIQDKKISFQAEVADLRSFRSEGGAIIFVVRQSPSGKQQIYFSQLLPLDLEEIFKKLRKPKQKTKSIQLKKMPTKISTIEQLFYAFVEDSKKQHSTAKAGVGYVDIEKLEMTGDFGGAGKFDKITFTASVDRKTNMPILFDLPTYIYGHNEKLGIDIPLNQFVIESISRRDRANFPVKLGRKKYYENIEFEESKDSNNNITRVVKFGSFKIDIANNQTKFTTSGTLEKRLKDLEFLIGLLDGKRATLNGKNFFKIQSVMSDEEKEVRGVLKNYSELKETMMQLGVLKEFDLDNATGEDWRLCEILINSVKRGISAKLEDGTNEVHYVRLTISNLVILVIAEKDGNNEYAVKSIYDKEYSKRGCILCYDGGRETLGSLFATLSEDDFITVSNLNYKHLLNDIKKYELNEVYENVVCGVVLKMYAAFDKSKDENMELLETAINIAKWHSKQKPNYQNKLNYLQGVKRKRIFEKSELNELIAFKAEVSEFDDANKNYAMAGINLLLESWSEFDHYFDEMEENLRNNFMEYPIYNLVKLRK